MGNIKKINCLVFSVARSDFGILKNIIISLERSKFFNSKLVITGAHFSKIFGKTLNEINEVKIKKKIEIHLNYNYQKNNSETNIFTNLTIETEKLLLKLKPRFIIILGDRFEALSVALTAFRNDVPIVHFCGGSDTMGSKDDKYRYLISKISDLHLVETEHHKKRLYENDIKKNIHVIGAPALENNNKIKFLKKNVIINELKIPYHKNSKYILASFHPETTLNFDQNKKKLLKLLTFFNSLPFYIIFTYPNADRGFYEFIKILNSNKKRNRNFYLFENLGNTKYFRLLKTVDAMIGNSSSGIIESSAFKLPTINVGNRQMGRVSGTNVINSTFENKDLNKKFKYLLSKSFKNKIKRGKNIYKLKKNSSNITELLKKNYFLK